MAREELCTLTNMCMVYDGDRVLVQNRTAPDWAGVAFPGGHVERGESFTAAVIREVREETGLCISNLRLCGIRQWTQEDGRRYIVFLYKTDTFSGEPTSSDEGEVFWVDRQRLADYPLADSFASMLPVFERDDLTENYWYLDDGRWIEENR